MSILLIVSHLKNCLKFLKPSILLFSEITPDSRIKNWALWVGPGHTGLLGTKEERLKIARIQSGPSGAPLPINLDSVEVGYLQPFTPEISALIYFQSLANKAQVPPLVLPVHSKWPYVGHCHKGSFPFPEK